MDDYLAGGRHFSGLSTRIVVDHVRQLLGTPGLEALLADAGDHRPVETLVDDMSWSTYDQFRSLLEAADRILAGRGGLDGIADVAHIANTTTPEMVDAFQAFESPVAMARATRQTGRSLFPILSQEVEVVSPAQLRWRRRMDGGFAPFPQLCTFIRCLETQMVRLFGHRVVQSAELACQCHGDDECLDDLEWDPTTDLPGQLEMERTRRQVAEGRLRAFQETVSDIVSAESLDTVLTGIVRSAARSVPAPGFVLAVEGLDGETRLYREGMSVEAAARLAASGSDCLSVDVESGHRRYGRLLAAAPRASLAYGAASLEAYGRLAATALDSAFALDDARRQARTAEAMLELSTSLAELSSPEEVAEKVARAMPDVIDCDCSVVLLVDDGVARVAAHHGYPPEAVEEIDRLEVPTDFSPERQLNRLSRDQLPPYAQTLMDAAGLKAMASAPLRVDGEVAAVLVASVRHDTERIFGDDRLAERFAGLAGQAAVALRNGRLLEQIRHRSLHDPLTGLPNRTLLLDRAEQMLTRARRYRHPMAALFVDLDGFKEINDSVGHHGGDELLRQVAARLRSAVRAADTVGRLGGDEFVVLSEGASLDAGAEAVAQRLLDVLADPFDLDGGAGGAVIGASIGIATGDRPGAAELLRDADIALYRAKSAGKNGYRLFEPGTDTPGHDGAGAGSSSRPGPLSR